WFARWLLPAESAAQGETLWIVALWFVLALAYVYGKFREQVSLEKFTKWEIGLGVIIVGQCLGCAGVWIDGGNLRSAVNGCWEWLGLGVSTSIILRLLQMPATRTKFAGVLMVFLVVLAGLGIWQHYVWYPNTAAHYRELVAALDGDLSPARRREIETELAQAGFPDDRQSRAMFEQRLFSSSEPIGFFALTNSLAGLLAVGTVVGFFGLARQWMDHRTSSGSSLPRSIWITAACGSGIIVLCLLLTKSRTAWVGTAGAVVAGVILLARQMHISRTTWLRGGIILLAAVILVAGMLAVSGGLDRQVLSEAPKSLKYRLEYWSGTWQVIKSHPWRGVGPGNFRQHYLRYKLPESSEEIADPHQMVLDLWVQGGIVSLIGLGILLGIAANALRHDRPSPAAGNDNPSASPFIRSPWAWGSIGSFLLIVAVQFVSGEQIDQRLAVCGLVFAGLLPFGLRTYSAAYATPFTWGLAALALAIHLQGAGGISMPAVAQLIFLLPALAFASDAQPHDADSTSHSSFRTLGTIALLFLALAACLVTAVLPTWQSRSLTAQGDAVLFAGQSPRGAENFYRRAAEADRWDPAAYERLAQLSFSIWSSGRETSESEFERGVEFLREAIRRDPFDHNYFQALGHWYFKRYQRTKTPADAVAAADMYFEAVQRYPENAELQWKLAMSSQAAGRREPARRAANRAAALDEINRRYSHSDKYLTPAQREELQRLLEETANH
ncbi:MAG: O-antigen ligase family protein, partial [Planctomycetaceae bacterium]